MRTIVSRLIVVSAITVAAVAGSSASAEAQTAQMCLSGQLRAASNTCKAIAKCYSIAMKKGGTLDPSCVASRSNRLVPLFGEIESLSNCLVEGGAADVASSMATDVAAMASALTLGGGKCAAAKMAALGKECSGYLRCYATAAGASESVSGSCLAVHEARLEASFAKAEAKGGCAVPGDRAALEAIVDEIAAEAYTFLRGTGTTTTVPTTSTSSTSTLP